MKKIIYALAIAASLALASCEENIPTGLVLSQPFVSHDSEYVTTIIPTAQAKNVLIEEFTGVRCSNCPNGAIVLKNIQTANAIDLQTAGAAEVVDDNKFNADWLISNWDEIWRKARSFAPKNSHEISASAVIGKAIIDELEKQGG